MTLTLRFAHQGSFSDPKQLVKTKEGEVPWGVYNFNNLLEEAYYLSKTINTSYNDILDLSLTEKNWMLEILIRDNKKQEEAIEKARNKRN